MIDETKNGIYAVIPTIRRDKVQNVISNLLSGEVAPDKIVVVDNGVGIHIQESENVKVIRLKENAGSEGGYYAGIKYSVAKDDCNFIFTSDDDTEYEKDAIKELLFYLKILPKAGAVRCAWSRYNGKIKEVSSSIWSGVLMKKEVLKTIGFPKKEFFLYSGDEEFFQRMRKHGYKIYIIPAARYKKRERDNRIIKMGAEIYSEPFRVYYAFRNEIAFGLEYSKLRVIKVLLHFIKTFPFMQYESKKAGIEGIIDGFRRKLGKNPKYLPKI